MNLSSPQTHQKLDRVQSVFRAVQQMDLQLNDWKSVEQLLSKVDDEFCSIAFEAASMNIALQDYKAHGALHHWHMFLNEIGAPHATQIHIGLGWALAQEQRNPMDELAQLHADYRYRVLDGYGYYEGFFRKRKSIVNQVQISTDDLDALAAYNQGLGRSLWYSHKADVSGIGSTIDSFPENRKGDLWRGLGIAVAYVGGCSDELLDAIKESSGSCFALFLRGVQLSVLSRWRAGTLVEDTERISKKLFGLSCSELIEHKFQD